jgi:hypothetical protein
MVSSTAEVDAAELAPADAADDGTTLVDGDAAPLEQAARTIATRERRTTS